MKPRSQPTSALLLLAALALGAAGCSDNNGSAEKLGQKIDRGTQNAKDATRDTMKDAATAAGDAVITAKVKAKVIDDPGLKVAAINVDTRDGVVVLTGTVDRQEDAMRAEQLAQGVDAVKSVDNRLMVRSKG